MGKRSGEAQAAQHRNGGPMGHRLKPRGGAKDDQADLLAEIDNVCPNCQLVVDDPYEHVSNYGPSYTCDKK
jgi:hypothetical protein